MKEIDIPIGVKELNCLGNSISNIRIPIGLKELNCLGNSISNIETPEGLEILNCSGNPLKSLTLREGIKELNCNNCGLCEINIPDGLEKLYCVNNNLRSLIVPESVVIVIVSGNDLISGDYSKFNRPRCIPTLKDLCWDLVTKSPIGENSLSDLPIDLIEMSRDVRRCKRCSILRILNLFTVKIEVMGTRGLFYGIRHCYCYLCAYKNQF